MSSKDSRFDTRILSSNCANFCLVNTPDDPRYDAVDITLGSNGGAFTWHVVLSRQESDFTSEKVGTHQCSSACNLIPCAVVKRGCFALDRPKMGSVQPRPRSKPKSILLPLLGAYTYKLHLRCLAAGDSIEITVPRSVTDSDRDQVCIVHPQAFQYLELPQIDRTFPHCVVPAPFFRLPCHTSYFYVAGQHLDAEVFCSILANGGFVLDSSRFYSVVAPSQRYSLYVQEWRPPHAGASILETSARVVERRSHSTSIVGSPISKPATFDSHHANACKACRRKMWHQSVLATGSGGFYQIAKEPREDECRCDKLKSAGDELKSSNPTVSSRSKTTKRARKAFRVTTNQVDLRTALDILFLYHGGNTWITKRLVDLLCKIKLCREVGEMSQGSTGCGSSMIDPLQEELRRLWAVVQALDIELLTFELWTQETDYVPSLSACEEEREQQGEKRSSRNTYTPHSFELSQGVDCRAALKNALPRVTMRACERSTVAEESPVAGTPLETNTQSKWILAAITCSVRIGNVLHDYSVATPLKNHLSPGMFLTKVSAHIARECGVELYYFGVPLPYMKDLDIFGGRTEGNSSFYKVWDREVRRRGAENEHTQLPSRPKLSLEGIRSVLARASLGF